MIYFPIVSKILLGTDKTASDCNPRNSFCSAKRENKNWLERICKSSRVNELGCEIKWLDNLNTFIVSESNLLEKFLIDASITPIIFSKSKSLFIKEFPKVGKFIKIFL